MTTVGMISGGASFWPWFGTLPSISDEHTVYGSLLSSVSTSPWLTVSEKERIEQLLLSGSLVIPPPQINIASFQNIALNFPDYFNISLVAGAGGLQSFGIVESAMTLAALISWAQSQHYSEADMVQDLQSGKTINPFEALLKHYTSQGTITGVDALQMQLILRQIALLQALLKTASPSTVLKAYNLAEQQLIIAFLQKWSAMEQQLAEIQRANMIKMDIQDAEKARQILTDYIKKSEEKQQSLQQPVLSMLIGSLLIDSAMMASILTLIPISNAGLVVGIPAALSTELGVITSGVIASTLMWAAPIAMTLVRYTPGISEKQISKDAASAFALTLSSLLNNPEFDALLTKTLSQAVASGLITESKAKTISATFKASLLLTAMAILYSSQTGGVSAGELRGIISGEVPVEEGDFLGVLAKLVREQLDKVDPAQRDQLLDQLLAPFDGNPSLDDLTSPVSSFVSGWNPQCIRDSIMANPG